MGFLAGDYTPHPNSLLFNAFPGFWPFKMYWFFRKVSTEHDRCVDNCLTAFAFCFNRRERSSSFRTSLSHPRATQTTRDLAATSTSPSSTEQRHKSLCYKHLMQCESITMNVIEAKNTTFNWSQNWYSICTELEPWRHMIE